MTVSFEKGNELTVVQEELEGSIKERTLHLEGVSYTYIRQGRSVQYLLDSFELTASDDSMRMEGECSSEAGVVRASFERSATHGAQQGAQRTRASRAAEREAFVSTCGRDERAPRIQHPPLRSQRGRTSGRSRLRG